MKVAIFDLDQTLVDSLERFFNAFNKSLTKFKGNQVDFKTFFEKYSEDKLDDLLPPNIQLHVFWDYFLKIYDKVEGSIRLIEGVKETLEKLYSCGIKIVIVTGRKSDEKVIWNQLEKLGIAKYVEKVYTAKSDNDISKGFSKTNLLRKILKDFKITPCDAFFVGDYRRDMKSAKSLGLYVIGVLTGHESKEVLYEYGADEVILSVGDLNKTKLKICEDDRGSRKH